MSLSFDSLLNKNVKTIADNFFTKLDIAPSSEDRGNFEQYLKNTIDLPTQEKVGGLKSPFANLENENLVGHIRGSLWYYSDQNGLEFPDEEKVQAFVKDVVSVDDKAEATYKEYAPKGYGLDVAAWLASYDLPMAPVLTKDSNLFTGRAPKRD